MIAERYDEKWILLARQMQLEGRRLKRINADLLAVAKAYEAWEADLVMNADWSDFTPRLTQAQLNRLLEIQAMRNAALAKMKGE